MQCCKLATQDRDKNKDKVAGRYDWSCRSLTEEEGILKVSERWVGSGQRKRAVDDQPETAVFDYSGTAGTVDRACQGSP